MKHLLRVLLYRWYIFLGGDATRLIRDSFSVFTPHREASYLETLTDDDRKIALMELTEVYKKEHYHGLMKFLEWNQCEKIAKEAMSMEAVNFARGTLNGYALGLDELEKVSREALIREKVEFNPHNVIGD